SVRYSSLSAANAQNIIAGGATGGTGGDNTSIWLIGWGAQSLFGIFPKGSKAGLEHKNLGEETVEATAGIAGTRMRAYRDMWIWDCGIALRDWRYTVRIPNIDVTNLVGKTSAADIIELMIKAIHRIPNIRAVRPVFYMNRTCMEMLDIMRRDDVISGGGLTFADVDGKIQYSFRGIPIRICDAILETETLVS
ncbi:MAG: major capsid protein, partial [Lentisphaerota bacterium]